MFTVGYADEWLRGVHDTHRASICHCTKNLWRQHRPILPKQLEKKVLGSFSFSPLPTGKLRPRGFKWPVPVIKHVPEKGDSSIGTPWGWGMNPTIKELARRWAHTQGATNTTSQGLVRFPVQVWGQRTDAENAGRGAVWGRKVPTWTADHSHSGALTMC